MNSSNSSLSPQIVALLVLVVGLALAGAIYTFMVKGQQEQIQEKRATLEQKQGQLAQYKQQVAQLPALREEVDKLEVDRDRFLAALPKSAQFGQVIQDLRTTVQTSNTDLKSVSFNTASSAGSTMPAGVKPILLTLSLSGKFGQVFNALQRLETQDRFSTIETFSLQVPETTSTDPTLESGLTMMVYTYDPDKDTTAPATTAGAAPAPAGSAPPAPGGTP